MKHNSREYIIKMAAPVFNKQGITGTSLTDVCKATGMTKGSIYANFRDKDELALEVFKYSVEVLLEKVVSIIKLTDDPHEKLMLVLDFYENAYKYPEFGFGCPVANTAPEADDTNQALRKEVNKYIVNDIDFFNGLIAESVEKGIYSPKANIEYGYYMIATLEGALMISKSMDNTRFLKDVCNEIRSKLKSWKSI
jgi:TetR/AcrR family transcriptional regulator, transcriptional repressor for nem operon